MKYAEFDMLRKRLTDGRRSAPATTTVTINGRRQYCRATGYRPHRCTGQSSDAMVAWAFGLGHRPVAGSMEGPADTDDLGACHETLVLADALAAVDPLPDGVVERMRDVYAEFWAWVICGVNPAGDHVRSTKWNPIEGAA